MKYLLLSAWLLCSVTIQAQQKKKSPPVKKPVTALKKTIPNQTFRLNAVDSNLAKSPAFPASGLKIYDPTINVLSQRATGNNIRISGSGIVGVPRGSYGIADGKLTLYSTGATSSGTSTGSGAVGTGTSPGAIGTLGPAMGVSGRAPLSGWGPYGNRVITKQILTDTTRRYY